VTLLVFWNRESLPPREAGFNQINCQRRVRRSGFQRDGIAHYNSMPVWNGVLTRRRMVRHLALSGIASALGHGVAFASQARALLARRIPSSGEELPVVGLGTWITFNVGDDVSARDECAEVMRAFFEAGGRLIDSSPMYGSSQSVIGHGLTKLGRPAALFSADKVWTSSDGRRQIEETRRRWRVPSLDLVQVHNLLSWEEQLPVLFAMKAEKRIRYVGITTSEGRRHREIEQLMRAHPLDFVQVTYNALDREVERRILPLAQERRIAVIVNRPFRQGELIDHVRRHPLPGWAREIDCANWAQFLLKFIVAHPAVTCAIPATSSVAHVRENMGAASGRLPDEAMRNRMSSYVAQL
jgi:diketogulonate reductase-like aldo/keto reductase